MTQRFTEVATCTIDGKPYRIVRDEQSGRSWSRDLIAEPPYSDIPQGLQSDPQETWHLGGFKSREGFPGSSEYGQNRDARWFGRIVPAPAITTITLTNNETPPRWMFEVGGYLWVVCGRRVYRIDTSDAILEKDLGAGVSCVMGAPWDSDVGLVTTAAATNSIWQVVSPYGTGDWTQQSTGTYYPYRIAPGTNRLFAVNATGLMKNLSTGLSPIAGDNYADSVQMGRTTGTPKGLVVYNRTAYVRRDDGVYAKDAETGLGVPILDARFSLSGAAHAGMRVIGAVILIPHTNGLYRYVPGDATSVGLEKELMNESPIKHYIWDIATDGQWIYAIASTTTSVTTGEFYILVARLPRGNEPSFGPLIWDTLLWLGTAPNPSRVMYIWTGTDPARLYFQQGDNVAYIKLGDPNSLSAFATASIHRTAKMRFGTRDDKDFPKIAAAGKNLSAGVYYKLGYSLEGAAFVYTDRNSADMKVTGDERTEFYLPNSVVGRDIQYEFNYVSNAAATRGELNYFEPFAQPQGRKQPVILLLIECVEVMRHEGTTERRSAYQQMIDLQTLAEQATTVEAIGPFSGGNNDAGIQVQVKRARPLREIRQEAGYGSSLLMEVVLQVREVS